MENVTDKANFINELSELYFTDFDNLLNYGLKFTSIAPIVEDAIQEIFTDLLSNQKKYASIKRKRHYLFKSVKYIILKELDKNSTNTVETEFYNNPMLISSSSEKDIIEKEESDQKSKILYETLEHLSPKEKESVYLKYISGLDYPEIADILSIRVETARTMVYRALKKIRNLNKEYGTLSRIIIIFSI